MKRHFKSLLTVLFALTVFFGAAITAFPEELRAKDITDISSDLSIETDMVLKSTPGSGAHAKLVIGTATAAVSFGIQYDTASSQEQYRGQACFMFENVFSNNPGDQQYIWVKPAKRDKTYRVTLTYKKKSGKITAFVNGKKVGSVKNPNLKKKKDVSMRAEGAARVSGDQLDCRFADIRLKWDGIYSENRAWAYNVYERGGLKVKDIGKGVRIFGTLSMGGGDWDSNYEQASSLVAFYGGELPAEEPEEQPGTVTAGSMAAE